MLLNITKKKVITNSRKTYKEFFYFKIMNITDINMGTVEIDGLLKYFTFLSARITEMIQKGLIKIGIDATFRFSGLITALIGLLFLYNGIKVVKGFLRVILVAIAVLIMIGLFIPFWSILPITKYGI